MARLAPSDNEHKLRNVAKEYIAIFLYKASAKGITLQDNEEAFELDAFFLAALRKNSDKRGGVAEIIGKNCVREEKMS